MGKNDSECLCLSLTTHIFATNRKRDLKLWTKRQVDDSQPPLSIDLSYFLRLTSKPTTLLTPNPYTSPLSFGQQPNLKLGTNNSYGSKIPPYSIGVKHRLTLICVFLYALQKLLSRLTLRVYCSRTQ